MLYQKLINSSKDRLVKEIIQECAKCPICNQKEDTTEHVLEFQTAETVYKIKDNNTPNQWVELVKLTDKIKNKENNSNKK